MQYYSYMFENLSPEQFRQRIMLWGSAAALLFLAAAYSHHRHITKGLPDLSEYKKPDDDNDTNLDFGPDLNPTDFENDPAVQRYPALLPEASIVSMDAIAHYRDALRNRSPESDTELYNNYAEFLDFYNLYHGSDLLTSDELYQRFYSLFISYIPNYTYRDLPDGEIFVKQRTDPTTGTTLSDTLHVAGAYLGGGKIEYTKRSRANMSQVREILLRDGVSLSDILFKRNERRSLLGQPACFLVLDELAHALNDDESDNKEREQTNKLDNDRSMDSIAVHNDLGQGRRVIQFGRRIRSEDFLYEYPDFLEYQAHHVTMTAVLLYLFQPIDSDISFATIYNNVLDSYVYIDQLYQDNRKLPREAVTALHQLLYTPQSLARLLLPDTNPYRAYVDFMVTAISESGLRRAQILPAHEKYDKAVATEVAINYIAGCIKNNLTPNMTDLTDYYK